MIHPHPGRFFRCISITLGSDQGSKLQPSNSFNFPVVPCSKVFRLLSPFFSALEFDCLACRPCHTPPPEFLEFWLHNLQTITHTAQSGPSEFKQHIDVPTSSGPLLQHSHFFHLSRNWYAVWNYFVSFPSKQSSSMMTKIQKVQD